MPSETSLIQAAPPAGAPSGTALRALFIGGDPLLFEFSASALHAEFPGATFTDIHAASDLEHALNAGEFDLAVADYSLGWADGDAVLASLKRGWPDCPVVLFTVTGEDRAILESMRLGGGEDAERGWRQFLELLSAAVRAGIEKADLLRQRRAAEQALRMSEGRLRSVFDSATDAIILADSEARILSWNRAAQRIFGYEEGEILGQSLTLLMPLRYRSRHMAGMARHRLTGVGNVIGKTVELHGLRKNGEEFPIELSLSTWSSERGICYSGMIRDITDRKKAEDTLKESFEQLRALSARVESIQEEERASISREMHDELGQSLTGLRMDIAWLRNRLLKERKIDRLRISDRLRLMSLLVDQTIGKMRRISAALRPSLLDELGLRAALEWQAQDFQQRTGVHCVFRSELEDDPADPATTTALFRIYQECLTNVTRHARARWVETTLVRDAERLVLRVRDDGRGIREPELSSPTSLGILGMRERARTLGGDLTLEGGAGRGTVVTVTVPCTRADHEEAAS